MGKIINALLLAAFMAMPGAVFAKGGFDLMELKCSDLKRLDKNSGNVLGVWMTGYICGKNGIYKMTEDQGNKLGQFIGKYCASHPDEPVIKALNGYKK